MGCMGMSMDDFCRCTPSEYNAIYREWHDHGEKQIQTQWEMVRMECLCTLQPYSRKRLTARDVMTFPWEEKAKSEEGRTKSEEGRVKSEESNGQKQMSREEFLERYRKAVRRAGLK